MGVPALDHEAVDLVRAPVGLGHAVALVGVWAIAPRLLAKKWDLVALLLAKAIANAGGAC